MLSRREFLGTAAAGAALCARREHLREFAYADVRLTGGPLKAQYDWVHAHFLSLDNDRLLKVYRQRAGLHAPGEDMGGWYDADGFVPGHTIGQYTFRDRTEAIDDRHADTVALMRGPLMMVAVNAPDGMPDLAAPGLRFAPFYTVRGEKYTTYFKQRVE